MNIQDLTQEQLDRLVAERVMGWLPPGHPDTIAARQKQGFGHSTYDNGMLMPTGKFTASIPYYSTSIADAWEVVWVFDTWDFKRWYDPETAHLRGGDPFFVSGSVTRFDPEEFGESGKQPTLQRAICIAALAATGVEL